MPSTRFETSSIKNKIKRQEVARKLKREKGQRKLQSRLAIAKAEVADPAAKRVRLPASRSPGSWLSEVYFNSRKGWPRMSPKPWITKGSLTLQS